MERIRVKEDADACILWVKCMLDGQYVEICPQKVAATELHWNANACIGRAKQARKLPGSASRLVMADCLCCWQLPGGSAGRQANQG